MIDFAAEPAWVRSLHRFWYGDQDVFAADYEHRFRRWYRGGPAFDRECRETFEAELLRQVTLPVEGSPRERHARVLLCDQLPRNMYRGTAQMFAHDKLAIAAVDGLLAGGYAELAPIEQLFCAVALEHSERLADVERSAELMKTLARTAPAPQRRRFASMRRYNADHLRVIRRFGRYPHRNHLLGRESTADERRFLETTSYRWMRSVEPHRP